MTKYVILQFIQLILIILAKFYYSSNILLLNILTLSPILVSAFFLINYHKYIEEDSRILIYSILSAILGDISLLYSNPALGISFFFLAQAFYYSYLTQEKNLKFLIAFCITNSVLCYQYGDIALEAEVIIYALITIFNIMKSIKLTIRKKIKVAYFTSFIFLMISELALFLLLLFNKYSINLINMDILYVIQWLSYIMFQILLVTTLINYADVRVINFLERVVEPYQVEEPSEENLYKEENSHKKLL